MPNPRITPQTETPGGLCCAWPESVQNLGARAQDFAQKEPAQAVGVAFLAGLILTVLPVGRLVAMLVRLAFTLLRPGLLILGAMKLCEEIEKRNNP